MQRLFLALVLLTMPIGALAQECSEDDLSPICTDMRTMAKYEIADRQMNVVYRNLLQQISLPAGEYLDYPKLKSKLIEAQRKWIDFRDAECEAWYVVNEAGTERNTDQLQCLIDRTNDRTRQLKSWQANLP